VGHCPGSPCFVVLRFSFVGASMHGIGRIWYLWQQGVELSQRSHAQFGPRPSLPGVHRQHLAGLVARPVRDPLLRLAVGEREGNERSP